MGRQRLPQLPSEQSPSPCQTKKVLQWTVRDSSQASLPKMDSHLPGVQTSRMYDDIIQNPD
jgi:hypothetical protein